MTPDRQLPVASPAQKHTAGSSRREFVVSTVLAAAGMMSPGPQAIGKEVATQHAPVQPHDDGSRKMTIVCLIRYEIDPYQRDAFKEYAARWGPIIPRCGASLMGYFLPWQGTSYVGWGVIGGFDSLAAYERYQVRLRQDPDALANFKFAADKRFIIHEERNFVEVVAGTLERAATQ